MKNLLFALAVLALPVTQSSAFEFTFDWGNIPRCTSGSPGSVSNPTFIIKDAPAGTASVKFVLNDSDAPGFRHGGGTAPYSPTIAPGAFKYLSPCPPNGRHTYVWTASALDAAGNKLDSAKSRKFYP